MPKPEFVFDQRSSITTEQAKRRGLPVFEFEIPDHARECGQERLSARVRVITPLHPYWGEECYIVRSDRSKRFLNHEYSLEVIGQPQCRAWFAANEIMDAREAREREEA